MKSLKLVMPSSMRPGIAASASSSTPPMIWWKP